MQGSRLKEVRLNFGLKQKEFGEKIGLTQPQIKNIETGLQKLTIDVADIIATKLAINGWWLLTGKGSMYLEESNKNNSGTINGDINSSNGGIVINGVQDCDINHQAPVKPTNKSQITMNTEEELTELCSLIKDYATPKYRMEIKEKLLRFKELH
jgi:DNA-binding XRE family transcriptional regulator